MEKSIKLTGNSKELGKKDMAALNQSIKTLANAGFTVGVTGVHYNPEKP